MEVTKWHCLTGERPWVRMVESGGQGFPFLRKHSASGVGASSSVSNTTATGIVASSSISIRRLEDFPADVFFNILLRLPLKSLSCCRCVCKIWRNIIDAPSFTNMHFTSRRVDTAAEPQLMHGIWEPGKIRLFLLMDDGTKVLRSSEFPIAEIANSQYNAEYLGYGLICFNNIRDRGRDFLLNPLRQDVLMLPPARATVKVRPYRDHYGVGFDCITETYKIVRVVTHKSEFGLEPHDWTTEVYTLGTSAWREISFVFPCFLCALPSVSAHGDVHWVGCRQRPEGGSEFMIMSFDIVKEEFKLTPHPNLPSKLYGSFQLRNFRGHLAMVDNSSTTHIEVWVLKDYDKKEWALEYRISVELLIGQQNLKIGRLKEMLMNVTGVGPWEHSLLFYSRRKGLSYYDPKTGSVTNRCIPPFNGTSHGKRLLGYIGSLVSLKNF